MKHWVVALLAVAACGDDGGKATVDAATHDAKPLDAAPADAMPDAAVIHISPAKSHTLYVNTEGVMISPGAEDATTNHTGLVNGAKTAAPWLMGDPNRQTRIDAVVSEITADLAAYDVSIVTTRPAAGPYDMVVITDSTSTDFGFGAGVGGVGPVSCNNMASVLSVEFPTTFSGNTPTQLRSQLATNAVSQFASEAGIPMSTLNQDCMCYASQNCQIQAGPCTIGGAGTMIDTTAACGVTATTMDENQLFLDAYGAHP